MVWLAHHPRRTRGALCNCASPCDDREVGRVIDFVRRMVVGVGVLSMNLQEIRVPDLARMPDKLP